MEAKSVIEDLREGILCKLGKPMLTSERVKILTENYEETKGLPMIKRRALALKAILENMTINIEPKQCFVGNLGPEPFSAPIYPENSWRWVVEQLDEFSTRSGDRFVVEEKTKKELREYLPKWEGLCVQDLAFNMLPEDVLAARDAKLIGLENMFTGGIGHMLPNYEKAIQKGFGGIKQDVLEYQAKLDMTDPDAAEKKAFYEAEIICCDAVCDFAKRYVALAENLADREENKQERERYLKIAETCRNVPEKGAGSFYEALQTLWMAHVIHYINQNGLAVTLGRMDQYLYPYYKKDVEAGILDAQKAYELLSSFWVNCNGIVKLYNRLAATFYGGFPITQAPQLGGYTKDGEDATNALSNIILDVERDIHLPQPDVAVLYTPKMDYEFIKRSAKVVPVSMKPKFFNTDTIVKSLRSCGVSEEDLKDVAFVGCVEQSVPGKTWGWHNAGLVNLGKCLELAMNDGVELLTGKRLGPATGKPEDFKTMDDVWNAFEKQVETATNYLITAVNTVDTAHRTVLPLPYESLLIEDCIAKGKELNQGGARYNFTGIQGIGLATVTDSLAAINKLVFEEKKVKLTDYIEAAKMDYTNNEELYDEIMNAPKFGNDIDEADGIAKKVVDVYCSKVENHKNPRGGIFISGMYSISAHVPFGQGTIKMDGNKINGPLSDGTSPVQGVIKNGPTGVAKSQAKLNHVRVTNGTLLNVKYLASQLKSPENIDRLAAFIKAFMEIGGYHVQINVTDVKELRDAQKNPEKYPYLLIRVAAYVALFNQLSKEIQDEIISRSELEI